MRRYAEPHSYSDCVANCDSYGYIYANSYTYFDTETVTDAETGANA